MAVIAINPDLIRWAREYRGLDEAAAAKKLGIPTEDWMLYELGQKKLNLTIFKKLSDRFRIPRATLLRQRRPEMPPAPIDYRTLEGRPAALSFDARLAVSYGDAIEQNILELVEANAAPAGPVLPELRMAQDPSEAGERERRRIGVSGVTQLGWKRDEAFRNWRSLIESVGVYVVLQKFPLEDCRGFTIYRERNAPIIVINKADEFEPARTFTLLHEYAHLLLRRPGLSDQKNGNPVEFFCNQFAAAFLMPRAILVDLVSIWPAGPVDWDFEQIAYLAQRLKVSQQALALRLEALGVAPEGLFRRLVAQQRRVKRKTPGGDYVNTHVNELGDRFTATVLSAEGGNTITKAEAADILDLSPRHFERVRVQIAAQRDRMGVNVL